MSSHFSSWRKRAPHTFNRSVLSLMSFALISLVMGFTILPNAIEEASGKSVVSDANLGIISLSVGTKIFVDAGVIGGNMDGTSWADAFVSLSVALDSARSCGIDTILVAEGTYIPTDSLGFVPTSDVRQVSFTLPATGVMLGGFSPANGIDLISERDWEMYPTILSGDLMNNDVSPTDINNLDNAADRSDNVFHIINQEISWDGLLDGFFFEGGNAIGSGLGDDKERGGAIYLQNCQGKISNCRFTYNAADTDGGAIYVDSMSVLNGFMLEFDLNYSDNIGGAIASTGQVILEECIFNQNRSEQGGAISSQPTAAFISSIESESPAPAARNYKNALEGYDLPELIIHNSNFDRDTADIGGAIAASFTVLSVDSTLFTDNFAEVFGGAVSTILGRYNGHANEFINNIAGLSGGGLDINGIQFLGEEGFFLGGPIGAFKSYESKAIKSRMSAMPPSFLDLLDASDAAVSDSKFYNNSSGFFGGGISWFGDSIIIKSTIAESNCSAGFGGAMNIGGNYASIDSASFSLNKASTGGSINQFGCIDCFLEGEGIPPSTTFDFDYQLHISHSSFERDTANSGGSIGASFGNLKLTKNKFNDNAAAEGGGAIAFLSSSYVGEQNVFINNSSSFAGGAIGILNGVDFFSEFLPFPALFSELIAGCGPSPFLADFRSDRESATKSAVSMMPITDLNVSITDGVFTHNSTDETGGAIYWIGDSLRIKTSRFDSNRVDGGGGAIYVSGDYVSIDSSSFDSNQAEAGGSIIAESLDFCNDCGPQVGPQAKGQLYKNASMHMMEPAYVLDITNSNFQRDSAAFGGSISSFEYDTRVSGSIFQYNYAHEYGGAIESYDSKYTGMNNLFAFNLAKLGGGAVVTELCLACSSEPAPSFKSSDSNRRHYRNRSSRNSKRRNNLKSAGLPEGQLGISTFTNSTFALNRAGDEVSFTIGTGGAFLLRDTRDTITNCIIYDNSDFRGEPNSGVFYEDVTADGDTVYIRHSLIEDSEGSGPNWESTVGQDGGGNIDEKPLFIDDDIPDPIFGIIGNFRLEACSPAIDAGTFTPMLNPGSVDLDGNMRVQGATVDMGAYEFSGFPITTRIYVDSSAVTGNNDGSSWENAFLELSEAMYARCLETGDTIMVAKGTYLPDTSELVDPRTASFPLQDLMVIIGGFNPAIGIDSIGEQLPFVHKSIMSGDIGVVNDSLDNCYHVINNSGITLTKGTLIDGMHISYGTANGVSFPNNNGGGMLNDGDTFDLANCTFESNSATGNGGALRNSGDTINITNCRFNDNISLGGAGALNNTGSDIRVTKSSFIRSQGRVGGAFQNSNNNSLKISDCYFDQNNSQLAGAAIYASGSTDTIIQCVFTRGSSGTEGSAIKGVNTNIVINNNTFFDNLNRSTSLGSTASAVNLSGSSSGSITNNIIQGNKIGVANSSTSLRRNLSLSINDHALVTVSNNIVGNLFQLSSSYPSFLGTDGGGNIDMDPQFLDTLTYDLRLSCNSPAFDKGAELFTGLCLTPLDFIDSVRVVGKRIDIGAYELQEGCQTIEVGDISFGEVCDTTTLTAYISNSGIGDLVIDTIVSSTPLFSYDVSGISFPVIIPYCDTLELPVDYNPVTSGNHSGTLSITSNAINSNPAIINMSGTLDTTMPMVTCLDTTVYLDASGMFSIDTSYILEMASDNCGIDTVFISQSDFNCNHVGLGNNVTITVRDEIGNENTCTANVTVRDTLPPAAICQNITAYLDASGMASITAADVNNGSSDACGIQSMVLDSTQFDCSEVGMNTVVLTVMDVNGNFDTCSASVTILDTLSPVMVCQDYTLYLDECGWGYLAIADVNNGSADNCSIELEISREQFGCTEIGANQVILTGTDNNENSASCIATVMVLDTVIPFAICKDTIIYLDASGMISIDATYVNNSSSDACGIQSLTIDSSNFDCTEVGMNDVVLTVTDNNDNVSTCTSQVTVLDTISPTAICQDITVYLDIEGLASIVPSDVDNGSSDACGIASMSIDSSNFDCTEVGMNTVVLTVTDNSDNVSTCTGTVMVIDTISPTAVCQDITVYLDAEGLVSIDSADIDNGSIDACGIQSIEIDSSNFDCTEIGMNPVVLTVTDQNENILTCTAAVTVLDTISPTPICQDMTIYLDENGMVSIMSTDIDNGSTDNCSVESMTIDSSNFDCTEVGMNTVVLTVTDNNNNVSTCTSQVTVLDTISPIAICQDITVYLDVNGLAPIMPADIDNGSSDACGIKTLVIDSSNFDCTEIGINNVVLTVTDNNDNVSTCTAVVSVLDTISPLLVCRDITVYLDAAGLASITSADIDNGSTDACGIQSIEIDSSNFDCSEVGMNTVVLTVTDNNDNTSTCTAAVTVLDTISPTAICKDITIYLDENGKVTLGKFPTLDEIEKDTQLIFSPSLYNECAVPTIPATLEYGLVMGTNEFYDIEKGQKLKLPNSDGANLIEVIAYFNQPTIVGDGNIHAKIYAVGSQGEPSELLAQSELISVSKVIPPANDVIQQTKFNFIEPVPIQGKEEVFVFISFIELYDSGDELALISTDGECGISGEVWEVWNDGTRISMSDAWANPSNWSLYLGANIEVILPVGSDNCSIEYLEIDSSDFDCTEVGMNTVVLTVTDQSGNTGTCQASVSVLDTISPTVICNSPSIELSVGGTATITPEQIDNGSFDACGIASMNLSKTQFTCADIGINEVDLMVTDVNGNTSSCTAFVVVNLASVSITPVVQGPQRICDSLINVPFVTTYIPGANYEWSFIGDGDITFKNNGSHEVLIDIGQFVDGHLAVLVTSACGHILGGGLYDLFLGGDAFCNIATCLREFAFVSNEVLDINRSIDVYKVSKRIKSEAEIQSPRSIIFKAGETIEMDPPFSVDNGSVFVAEIEACENEIEALLKDTEK